MADKIRPFPGKRNEMSLFVNLEPYIMCLGTAFVFGIGKIYYSLESPIDGASKYYKMFSDQLNNIPGYGSPTIYGGLERNKTLE